MRAINSASAAAGAPGAAGPQGPKGDPDASATRIRQVRQNCSEDRECAVTCADDEIAVNAFCPKRGAAIMTSLREISCGTANPSAMVALCAVTKKNSRTQTEKLVKKKYDPVAKKHVEFRETKIK